MQAAVLEEEEEVVVVVVEEEEEEEEQEDVDRANIGPLSTDACFEDEAPPVNDEVGRENAAVVPVDEALRENDAGSTDEEDRVREAAAEAVDAICMETLVLVETLVGCKAIRRASFVASIRVGVVVTRHRLFR